MFRIVQLSDLHCGQQFFLPQHLERAIAEVNEMEPDAVHAGEVAGVPVLAHRWLADLYADEDDLVVDVEENIPNDSLSLESEYDCRLTLRVADRSTGRTGPGEERPAGEHAPPRI